MVIENSGSTSMEFLGGYMVARACIRDKESFLGFCKAWSLLVALTIIPVLIEQVTGNAILMTIADAIPGVRSPSDNNNTRWGLERVQVVFAHPILYGLVCSTAVPLTYVALQGQLAGPQRVFRTGIIALCTFFALSSGALLAMLLQFFMIGWSWAFARMQARWTLLLIMVILAYITVDLISTRTPMRVFLTYATFSAQTAYTRLYIFEWGMVNVWANPIFGLGFQDWVRPRFMGSSVDNFWLLTAMRYGIPGFTFLASGYFILIWKVGRKVFDKDTTLLLLRRGWVFTLVGVCFTLATVHIWSAPFSLFAFLLGSGVWFLEQNPESEAVLDVSNATESLRRHPVYARVLPLQKQMHLKPQETTTRLKDRRYMRIPTSNRK
ncbi:O-antigen ligase family protein [Roseobacter litoralis]|nr:O-antigen ligase family protein [Roseobacter litoralis]